MGIILVVNPGSSSKKYALYKNGRVLLYATVTREGDEIRYAVCKNDTWIDNSPLTEEEYEQAITFFIKSAEKYGVLTESRRIACGGIRVVAPGDFAQTHRPIDNEYLDLLKAAQGTAPLHIPALLKEVQMIQNYIPDLPLIAISDSAFHTTQSRVVRRYSLPEELTEKYQLKKYGYHGLSVASVVRRVHAVTGKNPKRLIICHLGSGVSVTAVEDGKSLATSMGYAPGSGIPMASRAGDMDAGAVLEFMRQSGISINDTHTYLNEQGGLSGMTGEGDFRHVLERYAKEDEYAVEGLSVFAFHVRQYIGSYLALLGGVDAVVCTGTAGERSPVLRSLCLDSLEELGIILDRDKNSQYAGKDGVINETGARVKIAVMRTAEMEEIARYAESLYTNDSSKHK